ncbi:DEAD/DEAH box helicase family protein [Dialister hominis]|uniref:DEAD/DEAH box helicase family protein n=1 Tax=Dialister hominis TaxID=2582419 RepID=UPI003FEF31DC
MQVTVQQGKDRILLAMATGTGKTRVILALIYRFLKSGRFHRILYLVDRNTLGKQAFDKFSGSSRFFVG